VIGAGTGHRLRPYRTVLARLLSVSLLANLFALAAPVYVMHVCDRAIGPGVQPVFTVVLAGVCIIVLAEVAMRTVRARLLARLGERCERRIARARLQRLLGQPLERLERSGRAAHLARMCRPESLRHLLAGPFAAALVDLPFVPLAIAAAFVLGGASAWVAVAGMLVYALASAVALPMVRARAIAAAGADAHLQARLVETVSGRDALRRNGAEDLWLERLRRATGAAVIGRFRERQLDIVVQTLSRALLLAAAGATVWIGAPMLAAQTLTPGGFIAVLVLNWRSLAPFHAAFVSGTRLHRVVETVVDLSRATPRELRPAAASAFAGDIVLSRLGYRYEAGRAAALSGLDLVVPARQFIAVAGPEGAGKSTLLKLLAGLYLPQAGAVRIGGIDTTAIGVAALRQAIAWVPQTVAFFDGTVADNLRLACPAAAAEDIERALLEARVGDYAHALPQGQSSELGAEVLRTMPDGLKQRLLLARAWVKASAPLVLLDEPASHLDPSGEEGLIGKLAGLRGRATIIMVTHRPSHMRLADRLVYLDRGRIVHDAPPDQVLPLILRAA
jgi:ABC-type bacteriocin/lantibiotic exporter with double-glycine peptidase domain